MSKADANQNHGGYAGIDLARAIELLSENDGQLAALLHRLRQLEKMAYGPRSAKRGGPVDPSILLPFPGLNDLLQCVPTQAEVRDAKQSAKRDSP